MEPPHDEGRSLAHERPQQQKRTAVFDKELSCGWGNPAVLGHFTQLLPSGKDARVLVAQSTEQSV